MEEKRGDGLKSSSDFDEAVREFQKGLDAESGRKHRQEQHLALRRADRRQLMKKRRTALTGSSDKSYFVSGGETGTDDGSSVSASEGVTDDSSSSIALTADDVTRRALLKDLDQYVRGCDESDVNIKYECLQRIRALVSLRKDPPISTVVKTGIIPKLMRIAGETLDKVSSETSSTMKRRMMSEAPESLTNVQFEAVWILSNIASGCSGDTREVVLGGGIQLFVRLFDAVVRIDVLEQVIWGLGNIAGDNWEFRDRVLKSGILDLIRDRIQELSDLTNRKYLNLYRNICWAVSNFTRGSPKSELKYLRQCVPLLMQFVNIPDTEILSDALYGFSYLTDSDCIKRQSIEDRLNELNRDPSANRSEIDAGLRLLQILDEEERERLELIVSSGATAKIVRGVNMKNLDIKQPAIRAIGNLVAHDDPMFTEKLCNMGLISKLAAELKRDKFMENSQCTRIRKEMCWCLSNVIASDKEWIEQLIEHGLIDRLVHMLRFDKLSVKREACLCLCNLCVKCNFKQLLYLVRFDGGLSGLLSMFKCKQTLISLAVLESLQCLLDWGESKTDLYDGTNVMKELLQRENVVDALEWLQFQHEQDPRVTELASSLLDSFFRTVDDLSLFDS